MFALLYSPSLLVYFLFMFSFVLTLQVYEGERPLTKDNHKLGRFDLTGIPSQPRGLPQIEVTFEIDSNGILTVTAEDKDTRISSDIVIQNDRDRLSDDDIQRMIRDAELFSEADSLARDQIDARSELESYAYSLKQHVTADDGEFGAKLSADDRAKLDDQVTAELQWLDGNQSASASEYRNRKHALEDALRSITGSSDERSFRSQDDRPFDSTENAYRHDGEL